MSGPDADLAQEDPALLASGPYQPTWPAMPGLDAPASMGLAGRLAQAWAQRNRRRRLIARALRKRRELTPLNNRTDLITAEAVLCASVMRNEAVRLPHFLDHHRRLGVDHFLIVDNGSDDGTAELLAAQPDVSLWSTQASYRAARFGLDWLNGLLMRHGHGHWCLVLDADELLIYPHWETRPLQALTGWLHAQGRVAMPAMMLDLYPEGPLSQGQIAPGDDPLTRLQWFDAGNYSARLQPGLQSLWIQGGPRARHFFADDPRRAPSMNKIPLVHWHWRHAWLNSTHALLPPRLNQVWDDGGGEVTSGILLHTKFLDVIIAKSAEEKQRRQHFADPSRFGAYHDGLIADPVLHCPASQRLTGWRQLEALGLMSRGGWL